MAKKSYHYGPLAVALLMSLSCSQRQPEQVAVEQAAPVATPPKPQSTSKSIGSAAMDAKDTITLMLSVNEPGAIGDGMVVYKRSDPDYDYVLKHVGPLKPGHSVRVRPFLD